MLNFSSTKRARGHHTAKAAAVRSKRLPVRLGVVLSAASVASAAATYGLPSGVATAAAVDCTTVRTQLLNLGLTPQPHVSDDGVSYVMWTGKIPSWDGVPIMTDLTVPATADCQLPLVSLNQGLGADRTSYEATSAAGNHGTTYDWNNVWFASQGYATLTIDARGLGGSCGKADSTNGAPSGLPAACTTNGRHYWIQMDDMRYSLRDLQWIIGRLVDTGAVNPDAIGVSGGSMGGGLTWEAALLNDRTVCGGVAFDTTSGIPDPCSGRTSGLVPWTSPNGVPLRIVAAVPEVTWGMLGPALVPNGRTQDGSSFAATVNTDRSPIGVPQQSWANELYALGNNSGFFQPSSSSDNTSSWASWLQELGTQDVNSVTAAPRTPLWNSLENALNQMDDDKSTFNPYIPIDAQVPILAMQGLDDSLFPLFQAQLMWQELHSYSPTYPMAVVYADVGHRPSANPSDVWQAFNARANEFLDYELLGKGPSPVFDARLAAERCLPSQTSAALTRITGPALSSVETGALTFSSSQVQTTSNTGAGAEAKAIDPSTGAPSCPRMSVQSDPGVASWQFAAPSAAHMAVGPPRVTLAVHSSGSDAELNVRLWEMDNGSQSLMARGTYRLVGASATQDSSVTIELSGVTWYLPPGDLLKLEVTGDDAPTYAQDSVAATTTIDSVALSMPTTDPVGYSLGDTFAMTHGTSSTVEVVHFAAGSPGQAGSYTASIDWGDGTSSSGVVRYAGYGWYQVMGTHAYAAAGTYRLTTTVSPVAGGGVGTIDQGTARVS